MKKRTILVWVAAATALLAGCSGGGSASNGGESPSGTIGSAQFKGLTATAPADLALGQPIQIEWTLPGDVTLSSVQLDVSALASQSACSLSSGALAATATSTTITIPNACQDRTVNEVDLLLTVKSADGRSATTTRSFVAPASPETFVPQRINLPVMRLTTDSGLPITSKDVYVTGQWTLDASTVGGSTLNGALQIRGRGNSTWDLHPKKSYRLKLSDKQALLDMPSSKDWVLIANHADKTLVRNVLAMELGTALGMDWTPRAKSVEVFLNGQYGGVYLLMENIKIAKDRVNIDELDEGDVGADKIGGGYLLEVDFRQDGHTMFSAIDQLPIVFHDPEEPAPEQEAYIKDYIDQFESVLHSGAFADPATGYAAYIDVDSFIRWYLVNELFRNVDADMWSSCWMYKPRDGKLHMGPLWDFDLAAGNANYADAFETSGWWIHQAPWFGRLFEDPEFAARVRAAWNEMKAGQLPALLQSIDTHAAELQQAQLNNFQRWPVLETYVWPNYRIPGSYAGEIGYLNDFLVARAAWMDAQFNP